MKKIILTGGGTAGHVTPNLALLKLLNENSFEIHYIGTKDGIEQKLVQRENVFFHAINAGKLRRYFDLKNLTDVIRICIGFFQSVALVTKLKPSVLFSKGGFVSCPVVWAAWVMRVPVVIHESDITPGLANKLSAPFAKKICFSFPETGKFFGEKGIHTGLPVRDSLFKGVAREGRKICGFVNKNPVILIMGGSQGSQMINSIVRLALKDLLNEFNICHLCGKGNLIEDSHSEYHQFEYVNEELAHLMAMADIIVSRSGATTLFELLALKKPNLLIPLSTGASRGDQILNARSFQKQGYSKVIVEDDLTPQVLVHNVRELYKYKEELSEAMQSSGFVNGNLKTVDIILSLIK